MQDSAVSGIRSTELGGTAGKEGEVRAPGPALQLTSRITLDESLLLAMTFATGSKRTL
jgi:hypothetical protein